MPIRVRVDGTDRAFVAEPGTDLLDVFQENGEPIATSCGGVASCGLCRVTIVSGREALVPIKSHEIVHLGNVARVIGLRLACQARVRADAEDDAVVVVRIPPVDNVEERKKRKAERARHDERPHRRHASQPPPPGPLIEWRPGRVAVPQKEAERKHETPHVEPVENDPNKHGAGQP